MSTKFRPTPPDASALNLRVVMGEHGQVSIENGEGTLGGEFDRYYVHIGGYAGQHNPWVFAAAPELLAALEKAHNTLAGCGMAKIAADICGPALAKAHTKVPAQ